MNKRPLWATPDRRTHLVKLWGENGNRCLKGHLNCPQADHYVRRGQKLHTVAVPVKVPYQDSDHQPIPGVFLHTFGLKKVVVSTEEWVGGVYFLKEEDVISYWKADDRDRRSYLLKLEQKHLHALPGIRHRGEFDSIARDEFMMKRPVWEILAIGVNPFTHERVAKVVIHGTHTILWVDLSGVKKPSKNQKHKFVRYGKGVAPRSIQEQIEEHVSKAVSHYLL